MSHGGDCRTAPGTPGLLISSGRVWYHEFIVKVDKLEKSVDELNEKIIQFESKKKEIESKDKEAGKIKEKK